MTNKTFKNIINWIFIDNFLSVLLVVFFLSEAYGKLITLSGNNTNIQSAIKFIVFSYLSFMILLYHKEKFNIFSIFFLTLCFILGQYLIPNSFSSESIILFSKYLFPLVLFIYFNFNKLSNKSARYLFKIFEGIIILNSVLIILGVLFKISIFETYRFSRFGYNGLLRNSTTSTYFYIISLFYFLYSYKDQFISKWKSILVIIVCLFVGTKSIYLSLVVVLLAFLFIKIKNNKQRNILSAILIIFIGVLGYLLFYEFGKFNQIRESHGIVSSILSYRDQLFINKTLPNIKENWSGINYFLGGFNDIYSRSQMDFIDVFHFWGILGGLLYIFTYFKSFINFKKDKLDLFFIAFLIFIIFFAGNFFTYSTIPIYLIIIRERILKSKTNANYEHPF